MTGTLSNYILTYHHALIYDYSALLSIMASVMASQNICWQYCGGVGMFIALLGVSDSTDVWCGSCNYYICVCAYCTGVNQPLNLVPLFEQRLCPQCNMM